METNSPSLTHKADIFLPEFSLRSLRFVRGILLAVCFSLYYTASFPQTSTTSNLPIVVIDANGLIIPDAYKIPATFKITSPDQNGLHHFNSLSALNSFQFEGNINIEIRGASTTIWDKKPYGFETVDISGNNADVSLLGLPAESDWVLLASYGDKTFIRDALTYHLYNQTGRYAPRSRYVEIYLKESGQMTYRGIYILIEKIKRGANRVNIKKLEENDSDPTKITGGYIVQLGENEELKWYSQFPGNDAPAVPTMVFHAEYPKLHKYTNVSNRDLQFNYIKGFVDNFEQKLDGPDFKDPLLGYRPLLDEDAMIDYLLIQELTKNSDNWRFSTFFYKNRDTENGKLVMGPPWDFDRALGNFQWWCNPSSELPSDWAWKFNIYCPNDNVYATFWPKKLLSDCYFAKKVIVRYQKLRQNEWSLTKINDFIDAQQSLLTSNNPGADDNAAKRNFALWDILQTDIIHNPRYPVEDNTYVKEVQYLKTWLSDRLSWMDANIGSIGTNTEPCDNLPVVYKDFNLKNQEENILVSWSTSMEVNNGYFTIERSEDSRKFDVIGQVEGKGNSMSDISYQFTDTDPFEGLNYYRIRQTDLDGSSQLTRIKAIASLKKTGSVLYPNPSKDGITITNLKPGATITILDGKGNTIKEQVAASPTYTIPVSAYNGGIYTVTILNGKKLITHRILVAH